MNLDKYFAHLNKLFLAFILGLLFFADGSIFIISYVVIFILVILRTLLTPGERRTKRYLIMSYFVVMILQLVTITHLFFQPQPAHGFQLVARRLLAVVGFLLPIVVSRYVIAGKYSTFYLPSVSDAAVIGISEVSDVSGRLRNIYSKISLTREKLNRENLKAVAEELTRSDSFHYINDGTLTEEYFKKAEEHLEDENLYLVISRTGSPASEIISVFTQKQYNHASLSFDRDLQTTISYNGGERVYPPGLNQEMIEFFGKSPDASILVYSLSCPRDKKALILEKIREINTQGSAYNMVGLLLKRSYKPNIMFCSQFVYRMLEYADLAYFSKADGKVTPTDLIELDYYKKLKFQQEIFLQDLFAEDAKP